jgi:uncharacterized protein (TIGR02444 family)
MNIITLSSFWQFSLTLYKNDLVQSTLLTWQNDVNANVNLVLLCAMLNQQKITLTQSQIMAQHTKVSDFSNQYTKPLRALRHRYKEDMDSIEGYPTIRQKLLDAELIFEQQEQSLLLGILTQWLAEQTEHTPPEFHDNLNLYQNGLIQNALTKTKSSAIDFNIGHMVKLTDLNQYLV